MLSTESGNIQTRFLEPNVRDYQGKTNPVNTGIRKTLENPSAGEDFWWLNNGITVLARTCGIMGNKVQIEEPEIVNGLQTCHEVFNWYQTAKTSTKDSRRILLRIIVSKDDNARAHIIKATNSQTKVSDLSLLSTEPIQQTIEDRLRLYGLFYDRKKGQCRRLKCPIKKTVGMKAMAQSVIAIALREPNQARARPETFIRDNASKVFNPGTDADLYAACIMLDRQIDDNLSASGLTRDEQRDIRYYMGTFVASVLLNLAKPSPKEIAEAHTKFQSVGKSVLDESRSEVLTIYHNLGGTDQVAKGGDMPIAVQKRVEELI
jgi:hypothetical protein